MTRRSYAMIVAVAAVLAFAGISLNAAPQFFSSDLTVHETTTAEGGRGTPVTAVSYFSGNAIRRSSSDGMDIIILLDAGKMIQVNNKKKTYSEITFQQLQETMDKATAAMGQQGQDIPEALKKLMGGSGPITLTKQGPGENVAGFATEKYLMTGPWQSEIWAAPEVKLPAQYFDAMKASMPRTPFMDMGKMFEEMKKMNGFPVKTITTMKMMGKEMKSTQLVTSIEKGAIAKTVFEVPAGYKKVDSSF